MLLPPVPGGRRGYTLSGAAVRVLPGDDAAEGAADSVRSLLLAEPVQNDLEAASDFSPVRLAGAAINREHRDVVAWFAASRGYRMITANLASHPVFDRLRQLLR
jgi:hypothetical protein